MKPKENDGTEYIAFTGKTASGRTLTNEECQSIMDLPIVSFTDDGKQTERWLREATGGGAPHELDGLISKDEYIRRAIYETDSAVKEEIEHLRALTQDNKIGLEHGIEILRGEVGALTGGLDRASSITEKVKAEKRKAAAQKELKQREQQLFLDGMRLDVELEEKIKRLTNAARYTAEIRRQFVIWVEGK